MAWIIQTDNFDRSGEVQGCDEKYVVRMYSSQRAANVARLINEDNVDSSLFFKVVPDNYKLRVFKP